MMTILDRYISKEFVKFFALIMTSFTLLYLIIDYFSRIRMFLSNHATASQIISYFVYSIPQTVSHALPVAVLLSTLLTFGILSRHQEIIAMKANGLSLYRTAMPVLILSGIVCVCAFLFNELITPFANRKAEHIKTVEVKKREKLSAFGQGQTWYRSKNAIYTFGIFDSKAGTLKKITIQYFDQDFQLIRRIDAREARWIDGHWLFQDVLTTHFPQNQFPVLERALSVTVDIPEKPEDFTVVQRGADEMGYIDLKNYIEKLQSEGYDVSHYLADMYGKIAFSVVSIILALIGVSFALRSERSGGTAAGIGAGLVIGLSYWLVYAFSLSLGRSLTLPPLLSAWFADILFGGAALFMFSRVRT